jgi:hypothetical protein
MTICRFCEKVIGDQDEICGNCGYDPRTDTMTPAFVRKEKKGGFRRQQAKLSPTIKIFAFWGITVIVFSLGIKYQGKIGDIMWKAKKIVSSNQVDKSAKVSAKDSQSRATRLIDVRSYKAPADKAPGKDTKIEGIFHDPQGKSYVVINGQLISEKESFGNMVIKKINSDSVEVVQDGTEKVLKVNP